MMIIDVKPNSSIKGFHSLSISQLGSTSIINLTFDDVDTSDYCGSFRSVTLQSHGNHMCTLWDCAADAVYNYWTEKKQ